MIIVGKRGKKNIREYVLPCPDCGARMRLDLTKKDLKYRCHKSWCKGNHSADVRGRPLGTPAPKMDRYWRGKAHEAFDKLWLLGYMSKADAYIWLSNKMGLSENDCHISMMSLEQCKLVINETRKELKELMNERANKEGAKQSVSSNSR